MPQALGRLLGMDVMVMNFCQLAYSLYFLVVGQVFEATRINQVC